MGPLSFKPLDSGDVSDHPYQTQFQAFFEALEKNREMPMTSLEQAAKTHQVIFAADRSAALGRPVKLYPRTDEPPGCHCSWGSSG